MTEMSERLEIALRDLRSSRGIIEMSRFSAQYIAALLDNSGKIELRMTKKKNQVSFRHKLSVASNHNKLMEDLATSTHGVAKEFAGAFVCSWAAGPAYILLERVEPFLMVKQKQAHLLMQYLLDVYRDVYVDRGKATELAEACAAANGKPQEIAAETAEKDRPEVVFVGANPPAKG